jgi:hypothetical protein
LVIGGAASIGASARAAKAPSPSSVVVSLRLQASALLRLSVPDAAAARSLVNHGYDLAGPVRRSGSGYLVDAVVTGIQLHRLRAAGITPTQVIERQGQGRARYLASVRAERTRISAGLHHHLRTNTRTGAVTTVNTDTLHFLQAYWWTTSGQTFIGTQVTTTATDDPDVQITVTWRTKNGRTGSFPLQRFVDDNEYQYHFANPQPVPAQPVQLTATSSLGGTSTATPTLWPGSTPPPTPTRYQKDFITSYMTPQDIRDRIARLARQYPKLVDVIDLPNQTEGYRRTAATDLGPTNDAVIVESVKFGDEGMNGVQARTVDPGAASQPLTVTYANGMLTVSLATDASRAITSTTDDVAAAIQSSVGGTFHAYVASGSSGKTMPVAGPATMSDGLHAGANVPREPWTVQALRIGVHRDGSRIGVLAYSQEHAREWATPLVTLEFAERLLANYATNSEDRKLLKNTDIFVVPTVNPDGANYSFNDYNFQRKNMDDWCTGAQRDPANRNRWGVDVNRNYSVGSLFDGYVGASTSCLSEVSAGTGEHSEPESRNVIALAEAHPNIKFAMNVHSYGGYFMWPPGAYKAEGRITLPRPSIDESKEFLDAARQIVGGIASERGTVTWPAQTGPVCDVLYSAAGNSADELYYDDNVFAWDFEIGNDLWDARTQQWEGVGFQPPYAEAHSEAMEYATGLVQLVRVADQYAATRS